jgi:hypothetical protein
MHAMKRKGDQHRTAMRRRLIHKQNQPIAGAGMPG